MAYDHTDVRPHSLSSRELWEGREHLVRLAARSFERGPSLLQHAIDALQDLFFVISSDDRMMCWNKQYPSITGYADEEIAAMHPEDFFAPADRERVQRAIDEVYEEGRAGVEADLVTKSGARIPFAFEAVLLETAGGKGLGICGVGRDITERRQAERYHTALRENEARLRALLAGVPDLIFRIARDGTYLDVHAPRPEDLVVPPEKLLGRRVQDVLESGVATRFMQTVRAALADGETHPMEYSLMAQPDQPYFFEARMTALGPSEVLAVVRNITARRQADEELKAGEERYRLVFERSPEAIVIHRGEEVVDANAAAARLAGLASPSDLIGRSLMEFVLPHQRDVVRERITELENGRPASPIELTVRPVTGDEKVTESLSAPIMWKGRPASQTILHDVSAHKHVEETLRKQALLFESAHDAIIITDPSGQIVDWNPAAEVLFGYDREEVLGRHVTFLHPDSQMPLDIEGEHEVGDGEQHWRGEMPFMRKDGTTGICDTFVAPLYDEEGTFFGRMGINRDITEQKAYERGLLEAKEQAEEMARLKDAFLSNMSHEIRTPLTAIIGFAEMLIEEVPGSAREMAAIIRQSARRLHETLDSVLDLAQLEGKAVELRPEEVDVAEELRDVARILAPQAEECDLDLRVEVPAAPTPAQLDRRALHRIMVNLTSNAIKFTEEGYVRLVLRRRSAEVEIIVEDTGIGMEPEHLPRLFEAFRQESEGLTRRYEGSGLGLTITARLVDLMGGTLDVTTDRGAGSIFRIRLPRTSDA